MKQIIITILTLFTTLGIHAQVQCAGHLPARAWHRPQPLPGQRVLGDRGRQLQDGIRLSEGYRGRQQRRCLKYKQNIDLAHRYGLKVAGLLLLSCPHPPKDTTRQLYGAMPARRPRSLAHDRRGDQERNGHGGVLRLPLQFLHLVEKAYKQKPLIVYWRQLLRQLPAGQARQLQAHDSAIHQA